MKLFYFTIASFLLGINFPQINLNIAETISNNYINLSESINIVPNAICTNYTAFLDVNGNVTINANDIDGGSSDTEGGTITLDVYPNTFDCNDIGDNVVVLTVTDANGNTSTCNSIVTIKDAIAPEITCPENIVVNNDVGLCTAEVTLSSPTYIDNCECTQNDDLEGYTLGSLFEQSLYWLAWSNSAESAEVSNEQSNSGSKSIKITGTPSGGPVDQVYNLGNRTSGIWEVSYMMYIPDGNTAYTNFQKSEALGTQWAHEVQYQSNGIGWYKVNNTYTSFSFPHDTWFEVKHYVNQNEDVTEFFINNTSIINHPYTWTYNGTGGLNSLGAIDFYPGTNLFGSNGTEPNASAIPLFYIDDVSLCSVPTNNYNGNIYPVGTTDVVWTVMDNSGNIANCTQTVTVSDNELPTVICQDIIVELDVTRNATIIASQIDNGSTDNCGIASITIDINSFDESNLGTNTVVLTVTDINGNINTCSSIVTIQESTLAIENDTIEISTIVLYPNPTSDILMIINPQHIELEQVNIYDTLGKLVEAYDLTSMDNENLFDISNLTTGVYTVLIQSKNGRISKRLIKL